MAIFNGTVNVDFLTGTPDTDTLTGFEGNDILFGFDGDDLIFGNQNQDTINGNKGNDTLYGGEDDDFVQGGKDDDLLFGNSGNDILNGNFGNDIVFGEDGDDIVRGGKGNDQLFGGDGNDELWGDFGADTLSGGNGNDTFVIGRRDDAPGFRSTGGATLTDADAIVDFGNGQDSISLIGGLTFNDLNIFQGSGENAANTIVQDQVTGEFLTILKGVNASKIIQRNPTTLGLSGPRLIKDINPGVAGSGTSRPININGTLYFFANDGVRGLELWKSDGTTAGTTILKDIRVGLYGSYGLSDHIANINGNLYFTANDGIHGSELWKSNGTEQGTIMVADINPGAASSSPDNINDSSVRMDRDIANLNGSAYFFANDGVRGLELWKSNGTPQSTSIVADINPGIRGSNPSTLTNINGTLYFFADDGIRGLELWKSDGTTAGTRMVKDIFPGVNSSLNGQRSGTSRVLIASFANINNTAFFWANDGIGGIELWKTDGTTKGTKIVKDINPGAGSSYSMIPTSSYFANVNGVLYFNASNGVHGEELWKTDGTPEGTNMVADIFSGPSSSSPRNLTNVNGTLYFSAYDPITGRELWKSDGTLKGTTMVADIEPGANISGPSYFANINGTLYFKANDPEKGYSWWKNNSTEGTSMVVDLYPESRSSFPHGIASINNTVYSQVKDEMHGWELWAIDDGINSLVAL